MMKYACALYKDDRRKSRLHRMHPCQGAELGNYKQSEALDRMIIEMKWSIRDYIR